MGLEIKLVAVTCVLLLAGGLLAGAAKAPATKVVLYPAPKGEPASGDYTVAVDGRDVFVYTAKVLHGGPASFAYFDFAGRAEVKVTAARPVTGAVIRPLRSGVKATVEGRTVRFSLDRPRNLSVEINGSYERPLLLFANPLETDRPDPKDPNVLYFGPGVHEISTTKITSNQTVYVAGGAIVRGKILPGEKVVHERNWAGNKVYENLLCVENASNVKVRGRGILDMSALPWHSKCPIVMSNCTDVLVEGIIIKDSPCWCMPMFGCKRGTVRNVKQICHRENSDGINIVNSQDIVVEGCFLRNNDDEICVKTTSPAPAQESRNITVRNCVVWNDRAYAIGVTYETRRDIRDVLFKDCDIIHDHGIGSIAIHMSDGATVSGMRFEDIRVEDTRNRLVRFWIGKDFWGHDKQRGHIRGVVLKNVSVVDGPFPRSELTGADATHLVEDVTFDNLRIGGRVIGSLGAGRISANRHTKNIKFISDKTPPADAPKITKVEALPGDPRIALAWSEVKDPESGVDRYNVYRDGKRIARAVGRSYTDSGVREQASYTYRVAAVNGAELEGPKSGPAKARTLADTAAPKVVSVEAQSATRVAVAFGEPVAADAAGKVGSYALDHGAAVTAAAVSPDGKAVILTTSKLALDTPYSLTVSGLRDRAQRPNAMPEAVAKFVFASGLLGHWKLDEAKGSAARDSAGAGSDGVLKNMDLARCWVRGRTGSALAFDGEDDYVEIPGSQALRGVQAGSYTLCAHFKPAARPPGRDTAYNAAYAVVMKKGYHAGLLYNHAGHFTLCHWLAGNKGASVTTRGTYAPGRFHHVVAVVDRVKGEVRLYVNGKLDGQASYDAKAAVRAYGREPWRIGAANGNTHENHAWPANGVIDDVRIYGRALSDEEARSLAGRM